MPITRAHVAGALKVLNANNIANRKSHLTKMLLAEHSQKDVEKALSDLVSYPEWGARIDLDPAVSGDQSALATSAGVVKKAKKAPVK